MAANGNYYDTVYSPSLHSRNLHGRGYKTHVSKNSKDNGYVANRNKSRNWGSDLHIVTHTNANLDGGCAAGSANYFLAMWKDSNGTFNDKKLAQAFKARMQHVAPGGQNIWADSWAELSTNTPLGDAYIELVFHTRPSAQKWIYNKTDQNAYNYGLIVDTYLGYPS